MDSNMKLILTIKNQNSLVIQLRAGKRSIDNEHLTVSQNLDTLLIRAIDNLMTRNRIDRLSLKALEIRGNMRPGAVSSMILGAVKSGLECGHTTTAPLRGLLS